MFGISSAEMLILGAICLLTAFAGIIGIGVLIRYAMKSNNKSSSQEDQP